MSQAAIAQTIVTASLFIIFGGFFIWGWKTGQFKNTEDIKYIIFRRPADEDETKGEERGDKK